MSRKWARETCPLKDDEVEKIAAMSDDEVRRKWPVFVYGYMLRDLARELLGLRTRLRRAERERSHHARKHLLRREYELLDFCGNRWGKRHDGMDAADYLAAQVTIGASVRKNAKFRSIPSISKVSLRPT